MHRGGGMRHWGMSPRGYHGRPNGGHWNGYLYQGYQGGMGYYPQGGGFYPYGGYGYQNPYAYYNPYGYYPYSYYYYYPHGYYYGYVNPCYPNFYFGW